jgi:hypothetical protein
MRYLSRPTTTSYTFEKRDSLPLPSFTVCPQPSFHFNNVEKLTDSLSNGTGSASNNSTDQLFFNFPAVLYRSTLRHLDHMNMTALEFIRRTGSPLTMTRAGCFINRRDATCSPTFGFFNPSEGIYNSQLLCSVFCRYLSA